MFKYKGGCPGLERKINIQFQLNNILKEGVAEPYVYHYKTKFVQYCIAKRGYFKVSVMQTHIYSINCYTKAWPQVLLNITEPTAFFRCIDPMQFT